MQNWTIPGSDDQPIYGTTHLPPDGIETKGVALLCHGFKGYKDYGFTPHLAQALAGHGLIAHRFNFSHSGVTQDYTTFARPDLFERDTWGKQIFDLQAVAAAAAARQLPGGTTDPLPTIWFGHSRGGVTVLLTAARVFQGQGQRGETEVPNPAGVIAAASPQEACSLDDDQLHQLRHRGHLESPSSRTGQVLRVGKTWLEEIEQASESFDPIHAIGQIPCPVLLIHGDADQTVPIDASRNLADAGPTATLIEIPDASHTFNARNPVPLDKEHPPLTQKMISLVCDFAAGLC